MKRFLILTLTVIMIISALCVPSFAVISELPYVHANSYMLPEITPSGEISDGFDVPYDYFMLVSSDCTHDWDGNTCTLCGTTCEHNMGMDYYSDDLNYYECLYCMNCGYYEAPYSTVPHTYLDGVCSACGHECTHSSTDENGDCIFCTPKECTEHSFIGTVCDNCGYVCTHSSVEEGTCPDCGFYVAPSECQHSNIISDEYSHDMGYRYGYEYCEDCDTLLSDYELRLHTYVDGVCSTCGHTCGHSEKDDDGNCVYCTPKCTTHSFAAGMCAVCGYVCEHQSYTGGVCNDCGFQLPTGEDSPTPSTPSKPSNPPSPSAPSVSDDDGVSFGSFVVLLGGAAVIFGIIYAISALKAKIR